ncbi:MAG: GNAT family N-acetyltransferase [Ruminococcus sp.]|nr:GNAT family N-acetyltransferase [Ruminococcus sp.]
MQIIKAGLSDAETVRKITHETISTVYPRYYPRGAVDFFLSHHSAGSIAEDITNGRVYLCIDDTGIPVGTVSVRDNSILRLFVLPGCQGKGFGRMLLSFAEGLIAANFDEIVIDASLPAKAIYLRRGYLEKEYHIIETGSGDKLCYDVMIKKI